jgi:ABC-type molybdenum transport system ATPase subunit/photorepair protein PhrA
MTHLLELEQGVVKRARAARECGTRVAAAGGPDVSLARRVSPAAQSTRVLVALRNANVQVVRRTSSQASISKCAGDCWVVHGPNGSGKSLLRTIYGDHAVASGGTIVRAGIVPGVPLEQLKLRTPKVAPHLQTASLECR